MGVLPYDVVSDFVAETDSLVCALTLEQNMKVHPTTIIANKICNLFMVLFFLQILKYKILYY